MLSCFLKIFISLRQYIILFWGNSIGDDGCRALSEALPSMTNLQTLNLRGTFIYFQCFSFLQNLLTFQLWKKKISISNLTFLLYIECKNVVIFFENLYFVDAIHFLFWGNSIGVDGCRALNEVLPSLTNLQTLNLSCNFIHFQSFSFFQNVWIFQQWKKKYLSQN